MPDTATEVRAVTLGRSDQCTRSIEVRNPIANSTELEETASLAGIEPPGPDALRGIAERTDDRGYTLTDDRPALLEAYLPQTTPETCYAAALATIWRAAGVSREEGSFTEAIRATCGGKDPSGANYLQILSAVSFVHEGKRFDPYMVRSVPVGAVTGQILSRDGTDTKYFQGTRLRCPLPPFLCFVAHGTSRLKASSSPGSSAPGKSRPRRYSDRGTLSPGTITVEEDAQNVNGGLRWKSLRDPSVEGGVFPLRNAADLVYALSNGAHVVAGLRRAGHVVIIDGLHLDDDTEAVDRIRVIDPARPDHRHYWLDIPKGRYLEGVSFAMSIWNI